MSHALPPRRASALLSSEVHGGVDRGALRRRSTSPGRALSTSLRAHLEAVLGASLDRVRLHLDEEAALHLGAAAFAREDAVHVAPFAFDPRSAEGHRLLAHELCHVLQYRAGRLPRWEGPGDRVLDDPALEAEAEAAGERAYRAFAPHRGFGDELPIPRGLVAPPARPALLLCTVLRSDTKRKLRGTIENLVTIATPGILGGWDEDSYADHLMKYLRENPRALSGEKYDFRDKEGKLIKYGESPGGKIHEVVVAGDRVNLTQLDRNDWKWLRRTILVFGRKKYYPTVKTKLVSNLDPVGDWTDWGTTDCFFAAVLHVLGHTFEEGEKDIEKEQTLERKLALELGVSGRIMPDEMLIFLMEKCFKWKRMSAKRRSTLEGQATPFKWYLLSYCTDEMSDAWHLVMAQWTSSKKWQVVDRQAARNKKKEKLPGGDFEVDAWEVDAESELVKKLTLSVT